MKMHTPVCRDCWGVSAFFDPAGTASSIDRLNAFSCRVRAQGLPLLVVELAFDDAPFRVTDAMATRVIRFRSNTILWHKERLLNLGIRQLPSECRIVAWLDHDIVFELDTWIDDTVAQLTTHVVAQPYARACWADASGAPPAADLPEGVGEGHQLPSFAAALASTSDRRRALSHYLLHGHTGFAWAAHRDLLERHGLYDRAIVGGGDVINAHAFAADDDFLRGRNLYCRELASRERQAIAAWGAGVASDTAGRLAFAPGRVVHQFHGPTSARGYVERLAILRDADFDPDHDIAADAQGCWQWNSDKPVLHRCVRDYFLSRVAEPADAMKDHA